MAYSAYGDVSVSSVWHWNRDRMADEVVGYLQGRRRRRVLKGEKDSFGLMRWEGSSQKGPQHGY